MTAPATPPSESVDNRRADMMTGTSARSGAAINDQVRITVAGIDGTPCQTWTFSRDQIEGGDPGRITLADLLDRAESESVSRGAATVEVVGARVKFRDDHPEYPGMVGTVDGDLTLPGSEPMVSVCLDSVPATADEIEPFIDVTKCPDCARKGRYEARILINGRGVYTCPSGHRWQDANEKPSNKGLPLTGGSTPEPDSATATNAPSTKAERDA